MRIVIGEDSALFREGLARLLADAGHEIVAKAADAAALEAAVHERSPTWRSSTSACRPTTPTTAPGSRDVRAAYPKLGILLLSQHVETRHSIELVASGGFGYLLKDRVLDVDDFLDALSRVAREARPWTPKSSDACSAEHPHERARLLMTREREVLALMAEGRTNVGIAKRLYLSERTVETHVASILAKLNLANSDEDHRRVLAVVAYLREALQPSPLA